MGGGRGARGTMDGMSIIIFVFLFPLLFAAIWALVFRINAALSGWTLLAEHFHHAEVFRGESRTFQSARLNGIRYKYVLEIGWAEGGLYLRPFGPFRVFHRPLLIPWAEIRAESVQRAFFTGARLTFRSRPEVPLELEHRIFEELAGYLETPVDT